MRAYAPQCPTTTDRERDVAAALWVDDLRPAPDGWHWAKTSAEAIDALASQRWDLMSLDHDLGGDDTSRRAVLWLCENGNWPDEIRVHSANPVGVEWLKGMVNRYWEPAK